MNQMKKILFIDRDGTLIEEPADEQIDAFEKLKFMRGVFRNLSFIRSKLDFEFVLASTGRWSRKEVKELIGRGRVLVDGRPAGRPEDKCEPQSACIQVDGEIVDCAPYVYIMLHKPAGLLSATQDKKQSTVLDLLPEHLRRRESLRRSFRPGRRRADERRRQLSA